MKRIIRAGSTVNSRGDNGRYLMCYSSHKYRVIFVAAVSFAAHLSSHIIPSANNTRAAPRIADLSSRVFTLMPSEYSESARLRNGEARLPLACPPPAPSPLLCSENRRFRYSGHVLRRTGNLSRCIPQIIFRLAVNRVRAIVKLSKLLSRRRCRPARGESRGACPRNSSRKKKKKRKEKKKREISVCRFTAPRDFYVYPVCVL